MHAQDIDPAFGHHLAGLIDGEGCFYITPPPRPIPRFTLSLRADDLAMLEEIASVTGLGHIDPIAPRGNVHPKEVWTIGARRDCLCLVDILTLFPLWSKKRRDLVIWRQAVLLWTTMRTGGASVRLPNDWAPMERLRERLRDGRMYDPPPPRSEPKLPPALWED